MLNIRSVPNSNPAAPRHVQRQHYGYEEPVVGHRRDGPKDNEWGGEDGVSHVVEKVLLFS